MRASGHRRLDHHGQPGVNMSTGCSISVRGLLRAGGLRCRAQNDALRDLAGGHQLPQRDEQLARQSLPLRRQGAMIMVLRGRRARRRFAPGTPGLRRGRLLCQRAVLLKHQKAPRQLDHAAAYASVAGPLFSPGAGPASPFSRRRAPLSSGAPVSPPYRATALRSRRACPGAGRGYARGSPAPACRLSRCRRR